jgi:hypothetical protein
MSEQQDNLAVVVAWLDAMRRGDLDAVAELFVADVVWRGVPADAICHNRDEVLDMLEFEIGEGFVSIHALELIPAMTASCSASGHPSCKRSAISRCPASCSTSSRSATAASARCRTTPSALTPCAPREQTSQGGSESRRTVGQLS